MHFIYSNRNSNKNYQNTAYVINTINLEFDIMEFEFRFKISREI